MSKFDAQLAQFALLLTNDISAQIRFVASRAHGEFNWKPVDIATSLRSAVRMRVHVHMQFQICHVYACATQTRRLCDHSGKSGATPPEVERTRWIGK